MPKIKLFACDVDGTLTDGCMYYLESGLEMKKFNFRDGYGFHLLKEVGIKTAFITSETSSMVSRRANKLGIDYLGMSKYNKLEYLNYILDTYLKDVSLEEVAYIGDDVNDYELLTKVGYRACPADAIDKIKAIEGIKILKNKGGYGAVREFIDYLLEEGE